jgi:hypothetical protein
MQLGIGQIQGEKWCRWRLGALLGLLRKDLRSGLCYPKWLPRLLKMPRLIKMGSENMPMIKNKWEIQKHKMQDDDDGDDDA